MPQKYQTSRVSSSTPLREKIFKSLEGQEVRYKHSIPKSAVKKTLAKYGVQGVKSFEAKGQSFYTLKDKKGRTHGSIAVNKKSEKVNWWRIQ